MLNAWFGVFSDLAPELEFLLAEKTIASWLGGIWLTARRLPRIEREEFEEAIRPEPLGEPDDPELDLHLPGIRRSARQLADRGILTRPDFDMLASRAEKNAIFTVAEQGQQTIERIRDVTAEAVEKGWSQDTWHEKLREKSIASPLGERHLDTVFRTNALTAYNEGLRESLEHPLVRGTFPYVRYDARHDPPRVRLDHLAMEKLGIQGTNIYRRDDPIWDTFWPPWDYNCRCSITPVSVQTAALAGIEEAKRILAGETVVVPTHVAWPTRDGNPIQPSESFRRGIL